jgi:hypothetical protein
VYQPQLPVAIHAGAGVHEMMNSERNIVLSSLIAKQKKTLELNGFFHSIKSGPQNQYNPLSCEI